MSGTTTWYDHLLMFPVSGLAPALTFLAAVRAAGFMGGAGDLPDNMLGDPRDANGNIITPDPVTGLLVGHAFTGRPGVAAFSYTDSSSGLIVNVPAAGDPTMMYVAVRSPVSPAQAAALQVSLGLTPSTYGIVPADPATSAALLGVWA